MTNTLTVKEVIAKIEKSAAKNRQDGPRDCSNMPISPTEDWRDDTCIGERQGDVYLIRIGEFAKKGVEGGSYFTQHNLKAERTKIPAPGLETWKGSRHIIEGDEVWSYDHWNGNNNVVMGLWAKAPWFLKHPEHSNLINLPPGQYVVTRQMDLSTGQAVVD